MPNKNIANTIALCFFINSNKSEASVRARIYLQKLKYLFQLLKCDIHRNRKQENTTHFRSKDSFPYFLNPVSRLLAFWVLGIVRIDCSSDVYW